MKIRCKAFRDGERMPIRHTFQGKSINPRFVIKFLPEGTQELALICEDPDAPTPKPIVHWIAYGIHPKSAEIPEGLPKRAVVEAPVSLYQGRNSFLFHGYTGPNPGFWDKPHRYRFRFLALRHPSRLRPGVGRKEFLAAVKGNVIQESVIVGTYQKTRPQQVKAVLFWVGLTGGLASGIGILVNRLRMRDRPIARSAASDNRTKPRILHLAA